MADGTPERGPFTWNDRTEITEVYKAGLAEFWDDGGWSHPRERQHEAALIAVANFAAQKARER